MDLLAITFVFTLAWTSVLCDNEGDKLFFLQKSSKDDNETLYVVTWNENQNGISPQCDIITDKEQIKEVVSSDGASIHTVSKDEMQRLLKDFEVFIPSRRRRQAGDEPNEIETEMPANMSATEIPTTAHDYGIHIMYPGTKWCGSGDIAKSYDDLGYHQDTDRCCRAHDLCNDTLAPGETRNNLTNTSSFTKLNCECDSDFYNCLNRVNNPTSNVISTLYFNIFRRECYKEDYPETENCKKYSILSKLKCIEYEIDKSAAKVFKWVLAKEYIILSKISDYRLPLLKSTSHAETTEMSTLLPL